MERPKRAAAQKPKTKPKDQPVEKESDDEDELNLSEESSDGDFSSASSDEWDPTKKKDVEDTFEESEDEEGSEVDESEVPSEDSPVKQNKSRGNRSLVASLRGTTGNKYKRNLANRSSTSANLQEILKRAQFQKKKSIFDESTATREKTPDFDCSGGVRLSDSSGSDDESNEDVEKPKKQKSTLVKNINQASSTNVDLNAVHDNYKQMESAKEGLLRYKKVADSQKENMNIADLLAMGEAVANEAEPSTSRKKSSQKRTRATQGDDSDDDGGWEEVEEDEQASYKVPIEGVEIHLNNFNDQHGKKDAKPVDLEAQMKRKLNRRRKEHQVCLHKANLMSWVAHGNFVNKKLNDANLMQSALQLLPKNKNQCYPKDETDIDYFKQITNWFKSTIALRNKDMYTVLKQRPPLMMSLALQMKFKAAICRRDYVLIFVILLRAIGIQCRMVQSLVCAPIMPPKSELLSLAGTKKPEDKPEGSTKSKSSKSSSSKSKSKSNSSKSKSKSRVSSSKNKKSSTSQLEPEEKKSPEKSSRSSRSRSKKSVEQPVIPQLDGGDDQPTSSRTRKPLRLKALSGHKVDESFVDLDKIASTIAKSKDALSGKATTSRERSSHESPTGTKLGSKVRFSMDSPNSNSKSPSEKLFKPSSMRPSKSSIKRVSDTSPSTVFSPLKTRNMRAQAPPQNAIDAVASTSNQTKKKPTSSVTTNGKPPVIESVQKKDTLQLFSPRRLRSRSRSNEDANMPNQEAPVSKPNLKNLDSRKRSSTGTIEDVAKKPRTQLATKRRSNGETETSAKKAKATKKKEESESDYKGDTDDSGKLFKKARTKKKSVSAKPSQPSTSSKTSVSTPVDRRILSSESGDEAGPSSAPPSPSKVPKGINIWVEVYSEKDKRWIAIDVFRNKVDCVKEIAKAATSPMIYVFAWNNDKSLKDVSARYCANLNTTIRKMRVDNKYLTSVISGFQGEKTARDFKEDDELNMLQLEKPMPTAIGEFKNHPLYALRRHLLKYEAMYPPEPPILGYVREEAIYPRDSVFVLHTRETWLKEARVVKLNEEPYKMTKTLKWDNVNRKLLKDIPQELFGIWQTKDYEPPVAENGMVPRNAYGNVELFKPSMLPIGCVHLQLPGLNKTCRKLGVDCSQAIVGFDSNGGWPYPVYDGFIICQEFQEKVIDAWNRDQEEQEKKENEKYEKRVYGNWKKLIKGLFIKQRLKNKYNFEGDQ